MSRLSQVIQMGEIREDFHIYIEDYAYTYLKKQKGKDITKYFLYGEIEKEDSVEKLYVYGIGEKRANKIIEYRKGKKISSFDELQKILGVSDEVIRKIKSQTIL